MRQTRFQEIATVESSYVSVSEEKNTNDGAELDVCTTGSGPIANPASFGFQTHPLLRALRRYAPQVCLTHHPLSLIYYDWGQ